MKNLDNYQSFPETDKCYLDGRYFNKVFKKYPQLIDKPLYIQLNLTDRGLESKVFMENVNINDKDWGMLRIIIETPKTRHSNLILLDFKNKDVYRFEPLGSDAPYFREINNLIKNYLSQYMDFSYHVFDFGKLDDKNYNCKEGGFCVAYVIKFAYDFFNKRRFNSSDIKKFANKIEKEYGLLVGPKDIEYGLFDGASGRNVLLGGTLGTLGGAALTGSPTGAAVGLGAGLLVGGLWPTK